MANHIPGNVHLTPIAAVDTSTAASGVAMFVLTFDQAVIAAGNIIQFEYWQNVVGQPLPATANGFLPLENAVTTQGISNQCTIAIPSLNNNYNYNLYNHIEVKIRVYVGAPSIDEILVSEWSNPVPLYNAPEQPGDPTVFIIKGDDTQSYLYADTLFVQLPNNTSYDKDLIKMVVSYSYKNKDQEFTWIVSEPKLWSVSTYNDETYNKILIDPITMPKDVGSSDVVYVAVNAVFKYEHLGNNYYTVSQISKTVTAETPEITAPVLNDISIPNDYSVYADKTQKISLSWSPPIADGVPNYTVSHYLVLAYTGANKTLISTSGLIASNITNYKYTIPPAYVTPNTSTLFNFKVKAVYDTGASILSNFENVNTFTYSNAPTGLIVNWANSGSVDNTVDLALTFRNPTYTGQGTPYQFVVSVINNSSNTAATQSIPYISGNNPYTVYFNDVNTTSNGTVSVYLKTQDTNSQEYMNGLSSITAYQSSDLPLKLSHTNNGSTITSKWVSNTIIDQVCTMIFWNGSALISKPYNTVDISYDYSVTKTTDTNGDFIYEFIFNNSFFDDSSFFQHAIQCVSNNAGIGTGLLTPNNISPA